MSGIVHTGLCRLIFDGLETTSEFKVLWPHLNSHWATIVFKFVVYMYLLRLIFIFVVVAFWKQYGNCLVVVVSGIVMWFTLEIPRHCLVMHCLSNHNYIKDKVRDLIVALGYRQSNWVAQLLDYVCLTNWQCPLIFYSKIRKYGPSWVAKYFWVDHIMWKRSLLAATEKCWNWTIQTEVTCMANRMWNKD